MRIKTRNGSEVGVMRELKTFVSPDWRSKMDRRLRVTLRKIGSDSGHDNGHACKTKRIHCVIHLQRR